jgi:hypothetical protein
MSNAKLHIDELYNTGKTTFRDNLGDFPDYSVYLADLMAKWALVNTSLLTYTVKVVRVTEMAASFYNYVRDEMEQFALIFTEKNNEL